MIWKENQTEFTENDLGEISPSLLLMAVTPECAADNHIDLKNCTSNRDSKLNNETKFFIQRNIEETIFIKKNIYSARSLLRSFG